MASLDGARTTEPDFIVVNTDPNGSIFVSLAGELDLSTAEQLREALTRPEILCASTVHLDLTQLTFLDCYTIGVIVAVCEQVRSSGAAFSVTGGHGLIQRVIEISGLTDYFSQGRHCQHRRVREVTRAS